MEQSGDLKPLEAPPKNKGGRPRKVRPLFTEEAVHKHKNKGGRPRKHIAGSLPHQLPGGSASKFYRQTDQSGKVAPRYQAERIISLRPEGALADGEYHPGATADICYFLALLGAVDAQVAAYLRISLETLDIWRAIHEELDQALTDGRAGADAAVARGLLARAVGLTTESVTTTEYFDKEGEPTQKIITTTRTELAPDTKAAALWLQAKHPDKWVVATPGEGGGPGGVGRGGGELSVIFEVVQEDKKDYLAEAGKC